MRFIVAMECNKEDAASAKRIAEEKMKAGDFVGAHKFVTKAQRLFPDLQHIPQMIAICDVHSSANKKICGLDNWYDILQVQPLLADADTIKKQYIKLALLLHPDKNKFAGAEAAFKLVGEAKRTLSDQIKRSQYDIRYRSHSLLASRNLKANSGRRCAATNNAGENLTFWTCCNHCGHRYKHLINYMFRVMQCSLCQKTYVARKIEGYGGQPSSSTAGKKEFQDQGMYNISRQNASTGAESGSSAAEMDKNGTVGGKRKKKNQETRKKDASDRKPKKDEDCTENDTERGKPQNGETGTNSTAEIPKADVLKPQDEVKAPDTGAANSIPDLSASNKYQAAKKRRKAVEESSKSFGFDSSDVAGDKTNANEYNKRKSSRKNPQVSYTEGGGDGDFVSPPNKKKKSGCEFESDSNTKQTAEENKSHELADSGVSSASSHAYKGKTKKYVNSGSEDILSPQSKESEGCDDNGEDAASSSKMDKVDNAYKANENPNRLDVPDPKFNVFEVERKTENVAVNQVWSITDPRDGMPRKYARVKKVLNAEFKVRITYLEPVRDENDESIPIACGKFKNGETNHVDRSIFSSQMLHLFHNKIVSIFPRKGEIWAIFRDWKKEWNTGLEKHKLPYKYDFVEIVNDFHDVNGVGVAYLGKLKGSVPLFHWEAQHGICQIQFRPEEMLRFSHRVPAVKMTGKKKECVPANSYNLDPAALPKDIFQVDAVDMEMDSEILKGKADCPYPEAPKVEAKAKLQETAPSPRKRRKSDDDNGVCSNLGEVKGGTSGSHNFSSCQVDEKNTPNKSRNNVEATDVFKPRKSPRLHTIPAEQTDKKKSAKQGSKMNTPKKTDKGLVTDSLGVRKSPNSIHQAAERQKGESSKKQGRNDETPSMSKQNDLPTQLDGSTYESPKTTPVSPSCQTPRRNAFDFKSQRSEDKLRVDQIWAIYSKEKRMPTEYVKIRKIETKPKFALCVTHMELYPASTEPRTCSVSCGEFKLKNGRPKILPRTSLSHQVKPFDSTKNIVKVYPKKGEIWALYKNCDSAEEEHDIIKVVEDYSDGEVLKAVALTAKGSSSLYIIQRKQGSDAGCIDIPKVEMSRFSHQIPAVRHEKKATRLVEGEYWELDPAAIPRCTIVLD